MLFALKNGYQASHSVTLYVLCLSSVRRTFRSGNYSATYSYVKLDMHSKAHNFKSNVRYICYILTKIVAGQQSFVQLARFYEHIFRCSPANSFGHLEVHKQWNAPESATNQNRMHTLIKYCMHKATLAQHAGCNGTRGYTTVLTKAFRFSPLQKIRPTRGREWHFAKMLLFHDTQFVTPAAELLTGGPPLICRP
jgi:hypothetical protein